MIELAVFLSFLFLMFCLVIADRVSRREHLRRGQATARFDHSSVSVSPSHQAARDKARRARMPCVYCGRERGAGAACVGCGAPTRPKQYGPGESPSWGERERWCRP